MPPELAKYKPQRKTKPVSVSLRLRELVAAKELGYMPHEWDGMPYESRAEMIAAMEISHLIEAFQHENLIKES